MRCFQALTSGKREAGDSAPGLAGRSISPDRREFFFAAAALSALWPGSWFRRDSRMGDARFSRIRTGPVDSRRYFWVHGNERTAHDVLVGHLKVAAGRALLTPSTERNIAVNGGKLDPNRMFSRVGAEKNLRSLNAGWSAEQLRSALDRLDRDRPAFLRDLLPVSGQLLVALHNNGPGYSMTDEIPISDAVALNDKEHPDEFMLCTQRTDFQILSGGPFNVLLQNTAPKDDDGSLSRLCAARGIRYVNIEAALGNAQAQTRMLNWVDRLL